MSIIQTTNMKPFVATIPAGSNPSLDYSKISEARICAMMFYGGALYTAGHVKKKYINPYLPQQVKRCDNAGVPYALYVDVYSKSLIEADLECRALYYIVSEYPPSLGVWLSLKFDNTKEVNDAIIELYYKYLEKWGLKDRCGFYVTEAQLNKITWNSFKDRFYLWEIKSMEVSKIDDELFQPSMFEVPD